VIVRTPIAVRPMRSANLTTLFFEDRNGPAGMDYYIKGAVCWPEPTSTPGTTRDGYAILAGQDVQTGHLILFEEFDFATVPHWFNAHGGLIRMGLEQLFADAWSKYRCRSWFTAQDDLTHQRHARQVWESKNVAPMPEFIRVPYPPDVQQGILNEAADIGRFTGDSRRGLRKQWEIYEAHPDLDNPPEAVKALMILLSGYEFIPWVERRDRIQKEVFV